MKESKTPVFSSITDSAAYRFIVLRDMPLQTTQNDTVEIKREEIQEGRSPSIGSSSSSEVIDLTEDEAPIVEDVIMTASPPLLIAPSPPTPNKSTTTPSSFPELFPSPSTVSPVTRLSLPSRTCMESTGSSSSPPKTVHFPQIPAQETTQSPVPKLPPTALIPMTDLTQSGMYKLFAPTSKRYSVWAILYWLNSGNCNAPQIVVRCGKSSLVFKDGKPQIATAQEESEPCFHIVTVDATNYQIELCGVPLFINGLQVIRDKVQLNHHDSIIVPLKKDEGTLEMIKNLCQNSRLSHNDRIVLAPSEHYAVFSLMVLGFQPEFLTKRKRADNDVSYLSPLTSKVRYTITDTDKQPMGSFNTDEYFTPLKKKVDVLGEMREHLTCSICNELFLEPVTLQCSHSFCRYCYFKTLHFGLYYYTGNCPTCNTLLTRTCNYSSVLKHMVVSQLDRLSEKERKLYVARKSRWGFHVKSFWTFAWLMMV